MKRELDPPKKSGKSLRTRHSMRVTAFHVFPITDAQLFPTENAVPFSILSSGLLWDSELMLSKQDRYLL
jgi:hypothetical protein